MKTLYRRRPDRRRSLDRFAPKQFTQGIEMHLYILTSRSAFCTLKGRLLYTASPFEVTSKVAFFILSARDRIELFLASTLLFRLHCAVGSMESIPGGGDILDGVPTHQRAHSHTTDKLEMPSSLQRMFFGPGVENRGPGGNPWKHSI